MIARVPRFEFGIFTQHDMNVVIDAINVLIDVENERHPFAKIGLVIADKDGLRLK
jgi:phage gp29-like protein